MNPAFYLATDDSERMCSLPPVFRFENNNQRYCLDCIKKQARSKTAGRQRRKQAIPPRFYDLKIRRKKRCNPYY